MRPMQCYEPEPHTCITRYHTVVQHLQYNGVKIEDCITWKNGPLSSDRTASTAAWCFTNASTSTTATCNIRSCEQLPMSKCPSTLPSVSGCQLAPFGERTAWIHLDPAGAGMAGGGGRPPAAR